MTDEVDDPDPLDALRWAQMATRTTNDQVADLCEAEFGVRRWSGLAGVDGPSMSKQWGLVLLVDPNATGPYGHPMAPF